MSEDDGPEEPPEENIRSQIDPDTLSRVQLNPPYVPSLAPTKEPADKPVMTEAYRPAATVDPEPIPNVVVVLDGEVKAILPKSEALLMMML